MMNLAELKTLDDQYILNSYKRYPLQVVRGEGVYVYDENGRKYLDFLSGIAVNALGYSHPAIVGAIKNQAEKLIHISNLFYTDMPVMLAKRLCEISGMSKVFFCNSGAEANELAVKIARVHGKAFSKKKRTIVAMVNSFHGRTSASLSMTKNSQYGEKFYPLLEGPVFVSLNNFDELRDTVNEDTACIIIEAIQGEGGINCAEAGFLQTARQLADQHNALLVFDEVQCGLGRTGEYFGYQFSGVQPDVITLAKPLGAGLPMGAVLLTEKAAQLITYGDHGSTFGANCIAASASMAFLETIETENLLGHVKIISSYFIKQLVGLQQKYQFITEVRGRGLMLGLVLDKTSAEIVNQLRDAGLICNGTAETVLRFLPPYIITESHVDEAISIMTAVFDTQTTKG
jgi:predicted acetylornithine/succinylornithine family transaminase